MILCVFEGGKAEPTIFDSLQKIYLTGEEVCKVSCKHDLPTLYSNLKKSEYDLFRALPLEENGIVIPEGMRIDVMFSQIFLFFDYDFQNRMGIEKLNEILEEMLDYFNDETENGKLYINYPMVESLKYTKAMPDNSYAFYVASRECCVKHQFKSLAESFAYSQAKGYRFIDLSRMSESRVKVNWQNLMTQNVAKANYLITGNNNVPLKKEDISQSLIFQSQIDSYVIPREEVSILNSFPLFLYEYLK